MSVRKQEYVVAGYAPRLRAPERFGLESQEAVIKEEIADMLRYDDGELVWWKVKEDGMHYAACVEARGCTTERWASFGIKVLGPVE